MIANIDAVIANALIANVDAVIANVDALIANIDAVIANADTVIANADTVIAKLMYLLLYHYNIFAFSPIPYHFFLFMIEITHCGYLLRLLWAT